MGDSIAGGPVANPTSLLPWWMHDADTVVSLLSFLISIYLVVTVRSITKHYLQIAVVPKLKSQASTQLKNLRTHIASKDWLAVRIEAAAAIATAASAKSNTSGVVKAAAKKVYKIATKVSQLSATVFQAEETDKLIIALAELESHLKQFIENKKWQLTT